MINFFLFHIEIDGKCGWIIGGGGGGQRVCWPPLILLGGLARRLSSSYAYETEPQTQALKKNRKGTLYTGWERTGQMLCIVDTSLSVLMTLGMCLRELCCRFTVWI